MFWFFVGFIALIVIARMLRRRPVPYRRLPDLIGLMAEPHRAACRRIYDENRELFLTARGSSHNHQAWKGGYHDHVEEVMNYAVLFFRAEQATGRPLPFTLAEALCVLFLHDLEKPWRFEPDGNGEWVENERLKSKADKASFRLELLDRYGVVLTPTMENAMKYVEGEHDDYSPTRRVSNELAAFCHLCDSWSARGRYDYPKPGDPWSMRTGPRP